MTTKNGSVIEPVLLPLNLSYSQASTLDKCGGQYYLERGLGVPSRPNWAQVGGSAAHSATEYFDRLLMNTGEFVHWDAPAVKEKFLELFESETSNTESKSKFERSEFRATGRASKEWPDKRGPRWWETRGPEMVAQWMRWIDASPWDVSGVEVEFEFMVEETPVKGFIDRVLEREVDGGRVEHAILDLKFGTLTPGPEQLYTYRLGLQEQHGIHASWGTYYMAQTGGNTPYVDFSTSPVEEVRYNYRMAQRQRMSGDFRYRPSNLCGSCSVNAYCPAFDGEYAGTIPHPWEQVELPQIRPPREKS
ncbi:MAG: PD-(D/E)XK nuclease family protein [Dermatophilaceae bacterium]